MLRQMRGKRISEQTFEMACEWNNCSLVTTDYLAFGKHVKGHISDVQLKTYDTGESKCSFYLFLLKNMLI